MKAFCVIATAETKSINTLSTITKNMFPYLQMCIRFQAISRLSGAHLLIDEFR